MYKKMITAMVALSALNCAGPYRTNSQSADASSRLPVTTTTATSTSTSGVIALCNSKNNAFMKAQLMVYYDSANNYHPEYIRLYLPEVDVNFAKSNYQIVARKWMASLSGETMQDDNPLQMRIERLSDHATVGSGFDMTSLHWLSVSGKLQTTYNTTFAMTDAFKRFSFVIDLKDFSGTFDVLKLSLYKDGTLVEDLNMLMPAFYADPITYASKQNGVLAQLHPFYNQSVSSFSSTELNSIFNSYCF